MAPWFGERLFNGGRHVAARFVGNQGDVLAGLDPEACLNGIGCTLPQLVRKSSEKHLSIVIYGPAGSRVPPAS